MPRLTRTFPPRPRLPVVCESRLGSRRVRLLPRWVLASPIAPRTSAPRRRHCSTCLSTSPMTSLRTCPSFSAVRHVAAIRSTLAAGSKMAPTPQCFPLLRSCLGFKFFLKSVFKYTTITGWIPLLCLLLQPLANPPPRRRISLQLIRPSCALVFIALLPACSFRGTPVQPRSFPIYVNLIVLWFNSPSTLVVVKL